MRQRARVDHFQERNSWPHARLIPTTQNSGRGCLRFFCITAVGKHAERRTSIERRVLNVALCRNWTETARTKDGTARKRSRWPTKVTRVGEGQENKRPIVWLHEDVERATAGRLRLIGLMCSIFTRPRHMCYFGRQSRRCPRWSSPPSDSMSR